MSHLKVNIGSKEKKPCKKKIIIIKKKIKIKIKIQRNELDTVPNKRKMSNVNCPRIANTKKKKKNPNFQNFQIN
jgi:hypothetical protein